MLLNTIKRNKHHLIFWLLYYTYTCIVDQLLGEFAGYILQAIFLLTHHVVIFYSAYYLIRRLGKSEKKFVITLVVSLFFSLVIFYISRFTYRLVILKHFMDDYRPLENYSLYAINGITWYVQYFFMAAGFIFFENAQQSQLKLAVSEQQRLQTEANFLRAQINPHFLQNTLNFFYAQSLPVNAPKLSEGILLLSDMMRYSLSGQGDSQARVLLRDEIRHLQNFIAINQLRFSGQLQVNFSVEGDPGDSTLIPLALVTLLENAFKHGDLSDPQHPLQVQLLLDCPDAWLHFDVYNRIRTGPAERSSRIGLENTRRRLDMAYPGNYQLETGAAGLDFHARLKIFRQQV